MLSRLNPDLPREREDTATTSGFFGGMVLGALLGVVLTLVFAPRRGDETRALLASAAGEVGHKAVDLAHQANPFGDEESSGDASDHSGKAAIEREIVEGEVA